MNSILVTIDVEDFFEGPRPGYDLLFARTSEGVFGISTIMDELESAGGRGTFFFDVFNFGNMDEGIVREAACEVVRRGHEAGLHTHPEPPRGRRGLGMEQVLWRYSLEEQRRLIAEGAARLESWTGRRPLSHRAGGYGASVETLRILASEGFCFDSSLLPGYAGSPLATAFGSKLRSFWCEGLVEVPVTVTRNLYAPVFSLRKKLDVNWSPSAELVLQLQACIDAGLEEIVIFLHSYSFLNERRGFVGVPARVQGFRDFLQVARKVGQLVCLRDMDVGKIQLRIAEPDSEVMVPAGALLFDPQTYAFVVEQYGWSAVKTLVMKRLT